MKFKKWLFCALAISASAYFSIYSSNSIISDNIEALSSGDPNGTPKEVGCAYHMDESEMSGTVRIPENGHCAFSYHVFNLEKNPTCIPVLPYPDYD